MPQVGLDLNSSWLEWFTKNRPSNNAYLKGGANGTLTWSAVSPAAGAFTNPDYIFYRDGTTYNALNGRTGVVDYTEDTATNADACSDALQAAIDNMIATYGHGAVYFMPGATYVPTIEVAHTTGGVFLYSNGAYLDITGMDTDVFDFGDDATWRTLTAETAFLTGMSGFTVKGDAANTNTKLLTIRNICRPVLISNISFNRVNNFVEIRGGCYSGLLHDCKGAYVKGTGVKFVKLVTGGEANNFVIDALEISNSTLETSSIGVDMTGCTTMDGVHIHDCWLEKQNIAIKADGRYTLIHDNFLSASLGAAPKNIDLQGAANYTNIWNNMITVVTGGYGVYNESSNYFHDVTGNRFYIAGTGLGVSGGTWIGNISTNTARCDAAGGLVGGAALSNCSVTGNKIYGDNSTTVGFAGTGTQNQVSGNAVARCAIGWDDTGFSTTNIVGNNFSACTTDIDDLDGTSVSEHNMS